MNQVSRHDQFLRTLVSIPYAFVEFIEDPFHQRNATRDQTENYSGFQTLLDGEDCLVSGDFTILCTGKRKVDP